MSEKLQCDCTKYTAVTNFIKTTANESLEVVYLNAFSKRHKQKPMNCQTTPRLDPVIVSEHEPHQLLTLALQKLGKKSSGEASIKT